MSTLTLNSSTVFMNESETIEFLKSQRAKYPTLNRVSAWRNHDNDKCLDIEIMNEFVKRDWLTVKHGCMNSQSYYYTSPAPTN